MRKTVVIEAFESIPIPYVERSQKATRLGPGLDQRHFDTCFGQQISCGKSCCARTNNGNLHSDTVFFKKRRSRSEPQRFADNVRRPAFHIFIYPPNVFPKNSKTNQLHAANEKNRDHNGCKARHRREREGLPEPGAVVRALDEVTEPWLVSDLALSQWGEFLRDRAAESGA